MADLLLKILSGILMVVYLLLVLGSFLPQLGKLLFLLKIKWKLHGVYSLPDHLELTQQQSYIAVLWYSTILRES